MHEIICLIILAVDVDVSAHVRLYEAADINFQSNNNNNVITVNLNAWVKNEISPERPSLFGSGQR